MEGYKIGVIKRPIIFWTGPNMEDKQDEWGHIGMPVIIKGLTESHYNISDPAGVLNPIFAVKDRIEELIIKWKRLR